MSHLENSLLELILELMGGEANLKKGVSATRNSLHESFDSIRNSTIKGINSLPERYRRSKEEKESLINNRNITIPAEDKKLRSYLQTSEPGISQHEQDFICHKSADISMKIADAIANCKKEEQRDVAINTFKNEIKKYRENYSLLNEYKRGGDQALTKACDFNKEKKEEFYNSIPGGKELYERIKQAKLEGRNPTMLEKEIAVLVERTLNNVAKDNNMKQAMVSEQTNKAGIRQ